MSRQIPYQNLLQNLSEGPLTAEWECTQDFLLLQIMLSLTNGTSPEQIVKVDHVSKDGTVFNLDTGTIRPDSDYIFRPSGNCPFKEKDKVRVTCTNGGSPTATAIGKIHALPLS